MNYILYQLKYYKSNNELNKKKGNLEMIKVKN